jgi:beta-glucosidase
MHISYKGAIHMKNQSGPTTLRRAAACVFSLIMAGLLSAPTLAAPEPESAQEQPLIRESGIQQDAPSEVVVFDGSNVAPWRMYLGSSSNWMVPVEGPETTAYKSNVVIVRRVDHMKKDDAVQAEWKGGLGQVYFQEFKTLDLTTLAAQGGALSMVIRIDKEPKKSVDLKMDCGYPCAGTLNMTKLFKAVPKDQWLRVSFKISCFKDAGANLSHIVAPLVLATKGSFKMSISDVRLLTDPPPESLIACG